MLWQLLIVLLLAAPPVAAAPGAYSTPDGAGPFPAVVVLHGCAGVGPHEHEWAQRLVSWGYAALVVDSFGPRDVRRVCNNGMAVPPDERARDAFTAAAWLRAQKEIDPARIGVIGFSHGGWTVMRAVTRAVVDRVGSPPFRAAIAYYPYCSKRQRPRVTPVLVLIGDADDWTPAQRCTTLQREDPDRLEVVVYPGAVHAFDSRLRRRVYFGHALGYDPDAAADSFRRARRFLDERLRQ